MLKRRKVNNMPKSKIEWTQHTWNPVAGCTKISEGCQNCYAENMAKRFGGENGFKVTLHPEKLEIPLKRQKPTTYFVCSMSDLFHEDVPDDFIISVFNTMANAHALYGHIFQVLTKRPERMQDIIRKIEANLQEQRKPIKKENGYTEYNVTFSFSLQGIWLGVTAENQEEANHRIPILLDIPAALRFVSVEPMLGVIDLRGIALSNDGSFYPVKCHACGSVCSSGDCGAYEDDFWCSQCGSRELVELPEIDWVICGGESGQKARPLNPLWVKSLQEQCAKGDVPFFFKQWGEFTCKNGEMVRVGKKEAGHLIDGQEYREMPKGL